MTLEILQLSTKIKISPTVKKAITARFRVAITYLTRFPRRY